MTKPVQKGNPQATDASESADDDAAAAIVSVTLPEPDAILKSLLDTAPDALVIIDTGGIITAFSSSAERLFGWEAADVIGTNVSRLMPPAQGAKHDGYIRRYLDTGEKRIIGVGRIVTGMRKDGSTVPLELAVGEVTAGGRKLFTGFVRDITERQHTRKRLQELQDELARIARASEIGQMGAALAHEINQPLAAASNYLNACRRIFSERKSPEDDPVGTMIDKAITQVFRVADIVRRLRRLMEKGVAERQVVDVDTIVEEASALALIGARDLGVKVSLDLDPDGLLIMADRVQIQQVVLNLVRNGLESMEESTTKQLTIATTKASDGVRVTVQDSGSGISPTMAGQLFEPFITTKERGLGIGLSVCKSIIESHGGHIWAEPVDSGGTSFVFELPTVKAQ